MTSRERINRAGVEGFAFTGTPLAEVLERSALAAAREALRIACENGTWILDPDDDKSHVLWVRVSSVYKLLADLSAVLPVSDPQDQDLGGVSPTEADSVPCSVPTPERPHDAKCPGFDLGVLGTLNSCRHCGQPLIAHDNTIGSGNQERFQPPDYIQQAMNDAVLSGRIDGAIARLQCCGLSFIESETCLEKGEPGPWCPSCGAVSLLRDLRDRLFETGNQISSAKRAAELGAQRKDHTPTSTETYPDGTVRTRWELNEPKGVTEP